MTGGCSCGVIRYEIASFPLLLYTCNCTDCQTRSGSAFALNMPVRTKDFRLLEGETHHTTISTDAPDSSLEGMGEAGTVQYS